MNNYSNDASVDNAEKQQEENAEQVQQNVNEQQSADEVKQDVADGNEAAADDAKTEAETAAEAEKNLQAELDKTVGQLEELKDRYLRLSAEFDNYRKRTLKEKAELILNGGEKTIKAILPVIDDLERALQNMQKSDDIDALREGVQMTYSKFVKILEQNGVKAIDTAEQPLDTDFHEAIAMIDAPSKDLKGKVLDCVQTGYMLNDKVIRHAKVVVGK